MRYHVIIAAAMAILLPKYSSAQTLVSPDYDVVQGMSPWLTSSNRAALYRLPVVRIARAQADACKSDGGYRDLGESSDAASGSIEAQAYARTSDRITFYGDMGYLYDRGEEMGGPVLMDPSFNAINFYEYPNDNPGRKTKELYTLEGGMSYRLTDRVAFGIGAGYQSGNYSKRKDPRNLNRWMDLNLSLGTHVQVSDFFSFGADLRYRRTVESLSSRIYGVTGQNYFYFIDYGAMMGRVEVLGSDNYFVSDSFERPVLNNFCGLGLQAEVGNHEYGVSYFNELSLTLRRGSYGDKASSEILFSRNDATVCDYTGVLAIRGRVRQNVKVGASYAVSANHVNSFSVISNPGENLEVEYYGAAKVLDRTEMKGTLGYEVLAGGTAMRPAWHIAAEINASRDALTAYYYPYLRHQQADVANASASAMHCMARGSNVFEIGLEGGFRKGTGTKAEDEVMVEVSGPGPRTAQEYLDASWEYRTAAAASAGVTFRYSRILRSGNAVYVGIKEKFGSLLQKPEYLEGRSRNVATISVGCSF